MTAPELKPCPFCGGRPYLANVEMAGFAYVVCTDCRMQSDDGSQDRVIAAWNTRAPDPDLDAAVGAALAEAAARGADIAQRTRPEAMPYEASMAYHTGAMDVVDAILALRPTTLTALDRAKREARVEGMEAAAKPLTDAEAASVCLTYRHDFGLLGADERAALIWQAKEWHNAMRHHFRALIEAERGKK